MKVKNYLTTILLCVLTTSTMFALAHTNANYVTFETPEPHPAIIELLQNGESYSIEITSIGCFNGSRETLVVSKEADILTVSFQDFSKTLTKADIEAFINFELQLQALQIGGCTTVDTYVIRYGNDTFRTSDGTCSWNGGKKLIKAIS